MGKCQYHETQSELCVTYSPHCLQVLQAEKIPASSNRQNVGREMTAFWPRRAPITLILLISKTPIAPFATELTKPSRRDCYDIYNSAGHPPLLPSTPIDHNTSTPHCNLAFLIPQRSHFK